MYWHKNVYEVNCSDEEYHTKLNALIEMREKNTFKNHLFTSNSKNNETVRGESKGNTFTIWRRNARMNAFLYPIFKGEKIERDGKQVLLIRTRFNRPAYLVVFILAANFTWFTFGKTLFSPDRLAHYTIQLAIVDLIIILLFQTVPVVSYYNLKKQTLNHLKTYFNLTELK